MFKWFKKNNDYIEQLKQNEKKDKFILTVQKEIHDYEINHYRIQEDVINDLKSKVREHVNKRYLKEIDDQLATRIREVFESEEFNEGMSAKVKEVIEERFKQFFRASLDR